MSDTTTDKQSEEVEDFATQELATIEVFAAKCLSCKSLVAWAEKEYTTCHYTNGNLKCPASAMNIQIMVPMDKLLAIASKIVSAKKENDYSALGSYYSKLAEKTEFVRTKVALLVAELEANAVST